MVILRATPRPQTNTVQFEKHFETQMEVYFLQSLP